MKTFIKKQFPISRNLKLRGCIGRSFLALVTSALLLSAAGMEATSTLTVNSTADDGTGTCTASKCTLRDAILSAATGDTITFDPALTGETIMLAAGLRITRDGITITGNVGPDGKPGVTLDAGHLAPSDAIDVIASNFTLRRIRLSRVRGTFGLTIRAGLGGPQAVVNVRVESNEFTAGGVNTNQNAISVGMDTGASSARISNVSIVGNTFLHFTGEGDGVHVPTNGTHCVIENLQIDGNYFSDTMFPVELVPANGGTNNRIQGTVITRNTFVGDGVPINLAILNNPGHPITTGNVIADTTITQNTLVGNTTTTGGITLTGGGSGTANNQILNTQITNNLITGTRVNSPIVIIAGRDDAQGNHIDGVSIINNTIVNNQPDYTAIGGGSGVPGNTVSGVTVTNTIFWNNTHGDIGSLVSSGNVSYCITSDRGFAGVNGNIDADPLLGPLQNNGGPTQTRALLFGSPAIDKGTSSGLSTDQRGFHRPVDLPNIPNAIGGHGSDIGAFEFGSFAAPAVTTNTATNVASFSATLNGSINPLGSTTTVHFQYGTTTSYGFTTPVQTLTGNTVRPISTNISGLTASTVYHFRIVASNTAVTSFGSDRTFTTLTPTGPPVVTTNPRTLVASFSATLNGSLDPHGLTTSVHFQYGTTTSYGLTTAPQSQSGNTYRNVSASISSLSASTTYHFRIVATNSAGTRYGGDRTFTTLTATGPPVVTTNPATNLTSSSAKLNSSLDPHGLTTTVQFQWGTATSYGHTTPIQSHTGNTFRNISANISGLTAHTTYHFRIVATNNGGTRLGGDRTFTTP
jgi:CSLREA domain-containing protein